jgi:hypothetical protein
MERQPANCLADDGNYTFTPIGAATCSMTDDGSRPMIDSKGHATRVRNYTKPTFECSRDVRCNGVRETCTGGPPATGSSQ